MFEKNSFIIGINLSGYAINRDQILNLASEYYGSLSPEDQNTIIFKLSVYKKEFEVSLGSFKVKEPTPETDGSSI